MPRLAGTALERDIVALTLLSLASQLLYLAILPISIGADAAQYITLARFFAGEARFLENNWYRPPAFPAYLLATGMLAHSTFVLAIAGQAAIGVLYPLLVYAALRDVSRVTALIAAILVILTGIPYVYAKAFQPEHIYVFCLLAMTAAVGRFLATRNPIYPSWAMIAGFAAIMTRNDGLYPVIFSFVILLAAAFPEGLRLGAVLLAGMMVVALLGAWSAERASIFKDSRLLGALSNYSGHQLFWRIYEFQMTSGRAYPFWQCAASNTPPALCRSRDPIILVQPENGPATQEITTLMYDWAKRAGHDPDSFIKGYFSDPFELSQVDKYWQTSSEAIARFGLSGADALLLQASWEAVKTHPKSFLLPVASDAMRYFGVSIENLVYWLEGAPQEGGVVFVNDLFDDNEALQGNELGPAQHALPPALLRQYEAARAVQTTPLERALQDLGQGVRNLIGNTAGLVLLLAWPALLWARERLFALYLAGIFGIVLIVNAVGVPYTPRYEHGVLPFTIMTAALAVSILASGALFRRLRALVPWRRRLF